MKTRLFNTWQKLQANYWFIPAVLVLFTVVLSWVMVWVDRVLGGGWNGPGWIYVGDPEGARALLSTVAGSMITVAGVTFSITIVALALAYQQFGSRLLNNFMGDKVNQAALGVFVSIYVYCLLVMWTIRGPGADTFVPQVSVTVGILLTVVNLGVFIYFIHHTSVSIQADHVIAVVAKDLDRAIERLFPQETKSWIMERELRSEDDIPEEFDERAKPVRAHRSGYLQAINYDGLLKLSDKGDHLFKLEYRAGDFIAQENALLRAWPPRNIDDELVEQVNDAFILGTQRLGTQDLEFAINQLVEIALRALSPGINDPFTAIACIDRLGASLSRLAKKHFPSAYRYDDEGNLRLIVDSVTFGGVVDTAFNQIRQYGITSVSVTIRLLEAIAIIAGHTQKTKDREALRLHAEMIKRGSEETNLDERDRRDIERRYQTVIEILDRK